MNDSSNKKPVAPPTAEARQSVMKISCLSLGVEGNHTINWITIFVLIILAIWAYFVFVFLNQTCATMREAVLLPSSDQSLRIDVHQAQDTVAEIQQGKLY